jgi:hypothetical protein
MRLPARRDAALSRNALFVAIATTGTLLAIVAVGMRAPFTDFRARSARTLLLPGERLVYASAQRTRHEATERGPGVVTSRQAESLPRIETPARSRDSSTPRRAERVKALPRRDPRLRPTVLPAPSALLPSGRSVTAALTREQRDSVLFELSRPSFHELVANLRPTQAQRDSAGRETARRFADARDQGRPVAVPLAGGGFPVGIGRGPSREQRRRDSIVHDDYLRRLERLAVRVRSKQDSMRRADSIAALRTQRGDTTDD